MRRVNLIDILIILIIIFSAYSFITKESAVYEQVDEYYFTGSQIYKATNSMEFLDSKGFLYDTWVRGYWWSDNLAFMETGYVIDSGEGTFTFLRESGEIVEIGGRMSYKEQIGASEITLIIKTKSTVNYRMYSGTYDGLDPYLEEVSSIASFLNEFQIDDIAISGSIAFDLDIMASKVFDEQINDVLRKELFYVKDISFHSDDGGASIDLVQASIAELASLEGILEEQGIYVGELFSSDLNVFVRSGMEIGELDKYWIKEYIADNLSSKVDSDENSIHIRL